jgi:hypothetical protein
MLLLFRKVLFNSILLVTLIFSSDDEMDVKHNIIIIRRNINLIVNFCFIIYKRPFFHAMPELDLDGSQNESRFYFHFWWWSFLYSQMPFLTPTQNQLGKCADCTSPSLYLAVIPQHM